MNRRTRQKLAQVIVVMLALGVIFVAAPQPAAAASPDTADTAVSSSVTAQGCTVNSYWLPSMSILRLVHTSGDVVDLKRDIHNRYYTVHVAINGAYQGEHYVPVDVGPIQVRMKLRQMLETGLDGQVRQVYKEKPIVYACSDWSVYTISS